MDQVSPSFTEEEGQRIDLITSVRDRSDLRFRESDKGKGLRLGRDCLVKQNAVHGSGVLQLDLLLQGLGILHQPEERS